MSEGTNAGCARRAHPYRLGRRFSLGRNKQHQYVYRRGKSFPSRRMVLVYLRARELKVGFSVSSKVGNAVKRNRIRRILKEDFRLLRPSLKPGKYIIVARVGALDAPHATLTAELRALCSRAGVTNNNGGA